MSEKVYREIRIVDNNTLILWTEVGQNMFAYKDGAKPWRLVYQKTIEFTKGSTEFSSIDALYFWALATTH